MTTCSSKGVQELRSCLIEEQVQNLCINNLRMAQIISSAVIIFIIKIQMISTGLSSIKSISIRHNHKYTDQQKLSSVTKTAVTSHHQNSNYQTNSKSHISISKYSSEKENNLSQRKPCTHLRCQSNSLSTSRTHKPNQKSEKYLKQLIDKVFKRCQEDMKIGSVLTSKNIVDIFVVFGFFSDPLTEKDKQSFKIVNSLLNKQNKGINKHNFVKLIYIISNIVENECSLGNSSCNGLRRDTSIGKNSMSESRDVSVQSIGIFDQNNNWILTSEQQGRIKSKLGYLYYNRISNSNVKYTHPLKQQQFEQPRLSQNSSRLSIKHRKHLESINQSNNSVNELYQRQQIYKQKHKQWIQRQVNMLKQKELQGCHFRPSINKQINTDRSRKHTSITILDKGDNKENRVFTRRGHERLTSVEKKQISELKQCSFKPKLTSYKQFDTNIFTIKNSEKTIARIQEAYKKKLQINSKKQRGYPKSNYRPMKSTQNMNEYSKDNPILEVDIKIKDNAVSLKIFEGELLQNLVCKILVMNKLPYEYVNRIEQMLEQTIRNSQTAIIKNGFVASK